ncbi:hypothetical protein GCM10009665_71400 [Kitasatospora nipponensis]|uniref:Uncharacterized protein n=1 Tax=Kitasatospora nipponensis TaxID=258049 RepID=A0ABN1X0Q2_9ACTN
MQNALTDWVDDLLQRKGKYAFLTPITGTLSLLLILVPLGVVGLAVAQWIGGGVACALLFIAVGYYALRLGQTRALVEERARVLNRYAARVMNESGPGAFWIEDWEEEVQVSKGGDTTIDRWLTIRVGDSPLYSCWNAAYQTLGNVTDRARRRVRSYAHAFDDHTKRQGLRYDVTDRWDGNKNRIFVHFPDPVPAHDARGVQVSWSWPAYSAALLRGDGAEDFEWMPRRRIKRLKATITFAKECKLQEEPRMDIINGPAPKITTRRHHVYTIEAEYLDMEPDIKVGFRLTMPRSDEFES